MNYKSIKNNAITFFLSSHGSILCFVAYTILMVLAQTFITIKTDDTNLGIVFGFFTYLFFLSFHFVLTNKFRQNGYK